MGDTTSMNLRVDKKLKQDAETLFNSLGMNMTTAINIFLKQSVRNQCIPFRVTASKGYEEIAPYRASTDSYNNHAEYVANALKATDLKVAEGSMKYYTADEIRAKLEDVLNEKL